MTEEPTRVIKLFYCYARKDKELRDELDLHLAPLRRSGKITSWHDGEISAGVEWEKEIIDHLNTAHIILLLVSPDFMGSDYCYSKEMARALERHHAGEARVIPILLRPVFWEVAPFSKLQILPNDAKAITLWLNHDEALEAVAKGIHKAVTEISSKANDQYTIFEQSSNPKLVSTDEVVHPSFRDIEEIPTPHHEKTDVGKVTTSTPERATRRGGRDNQRQLFTVLDIGDASVKAVIVEVHGDQVKVLGVGRYPQSHIHISNGIITDITKVIANCKQALLKAKQAAGGITAPVTIIGVTGELVKGRSIMVHRQRQNPLEPITPEDLESIITSAQQKLLKDAKEYIAAETGYPDIEIRLVNSAMISAYIDGQFVPNPIGFRGRRLTIALFSAFAPLTQLGALESIVNEGLGLTLVSIVAGPYALARCLSRDANPDSGAIFIDIGAETTGIALVCQGSIEGIQIFAHGGQAFTRRIARSMGIDIKNAEQLKKSYSRGDIKDERRDEIQAILAPECQAWMTRVELLIEDLAKGELLPPAIYIVGGGSKLPDLHQELASFPWTERLPFSHPPPIEAVLPQMVPYVYDSNRLLVDVQDITLMALAYQAVELQNENSLLDRALYRVIHKMHI